MKKSIIISKRPPYKCVVCSSTNVEFTIDYRDPARPGDGPQMKDSKQIIHWPTAKVLSCAKCLEVAVYKLMNDQGLLNKTEETCETLNSPNQ